MADFGENPGPRHFPKLPILNQSELPALNQREKYGGLFYLGIGGLLVLIVLVSWFSFNVWNLRDVWRDVYALHDGSRPEAERIQAAFRLSRDSRLGDAQLMEMSLDRRIPDLARYLLAEAVSTDAVARDPRSYAFTVARSPDWPDWLRLVLARRLAYGAGRGYEIPREALDELAKHTDPMIALWAKYALAESPDGDAVLSKELEKAAAEPGETATLAKFLLTALPASETTRKPTLDDATDWMRRHHPGAGADLGWLEYQRRAFAPVRGPIKKNLSRGPSTTFRECQTYPVESRLRRPLLDNVAGLFGANIQASCFRTGAVARPR